MPRPASRFHLRFACALCHAHGLLLAMFLVWHQSSPLVAAEPVADSTASLAPAFEQQVKPFLSKHCLRCHNGDKASSGIRVDQLNGELEDRHIRLWQGIRQQLVDEAMPPEDERQPTAAERQQLCEWIDRAIHVARSRPRPKNGLVRRLTAAQYRNTLRELLQLDDDLTDVLPPDAVSRDGFVNNSETLQLSPLLLEAYFQIAEDALNRCIVDVNAKPTIQNFRVDFGAAINPQPCPDKLVLGALSMLLDNADFMVTELTPQKPFPFEPFRMRTKYRFIEGYEGNATVRNWRDFDSIYHAVFACVRGTPGYPKGDPYNTVPGGLLLRPAMPNDDHTYGPRTNFKISLRELPDNGRFRVTVTAAKYDDGLLLEPGVRPRSENPAAVVCAAPQQASSVTIKQPGVYQIDVYPHQLERPKPDASRLTEGLLAAWPLDGAPTSQPERPELAGRLQEGAKFAGSPFGKALSLTGQSMIVAQHEALDVGAGDFTVAAWIHPRRLQQAGIVARGRPDWTQGWYLDMPDDQGIVRFETRGPDGKSNGALKSPRGSLVAGAWQHVAAVVRRAPGESQLYINGFLAAKGKIGSASVDNPRVDLHLGRVPGGPALFGDLDDVRLYRRALDESELQALLQPGLKLLPQTDKPHDLALTLGERNFSAKLRQPAFLAVRLPAGELPLKVRYSSANKLERVVFTPLEASDETARSFAAFERRSPRVGVHVGLRRDCGSSLAPVEGPQTVSQTALSTFTFTGAMHNFPSPDVEKDNVNYLAGVREIGVRSECTDSRDMPRLLIRSVEFEGPFYEQWPPESHRNIFVDFKRQDDRPAYGREIIRRFATRAFRRTVTTDELAALVGLFDRAQADGTGFQESIKYTLRAVLTSPQFLFLIEHSDTPRPEPVTDDELASKLSYFLWNGPPDRRLLELAAAGKLRLELDAEVSRMVEDQRLSRFVGEFASQWLNLDKFDVLEPDRQRFPKLTNATRAQLRQEPAQLVEYLIRHNLSIRELIEADYVVANEVVASYYDLGGKTESGFDFVPFRHGRNEMGGLFAQAAIMAGLSDGRESNPVKRGAWLARRIIAEPPDDPPPNVPALEKEEGKLTLRQRLERHRNQPGCAQCHAKIDPWGLPLESFDAGGRLKAEPVESASTLPDKTNVSGANDLKRYLAHDRIDQVAFSVLKHLATYATGRSLTFNELEFLKQHGLKLKPDGYRLQDMIRFVVTSELFLEK